jgi:DNA modification methylase
VLEGLSEGVTCRLWNEDCIEGMMSRLEPDSVDLTVTSPPFEGLFTYSAHDMDMGNNESTNDLREGRFAINFRFWAEQLLRVHRPGTNACIHIQQLIAHKVQHGFMGRRDFRGMVIDICRAAGWDYIGEIVVWKDPQMVATRTHLHSLQFKTGHSRGSQMWSPAPNDFVVIVQKPGESKYKVYPLATREGKNPDGWMTEKDWILWARGTWDISETDVLDSGSSTMKLNKFKEAPDERHVCPLQLSLIRRLVMMYSNPAEVQPNSTVLDPFMGIGSTAYTALGGRSVHSGFGVGKPRNVVGFELKPSYFKAAVNHARIAFDPAACRRRKESSLFGDSEDS